MKKNANEWSLPWSAQLMSWFLWYFSILIIIAFVVQFYFYEPVDATE